MKKRFIGGHERCVVDQRRCRNETVRGIGGQAFQFSCPERDVAGQWKLQNSRLEDRGALRRGRTQG